MVSSAEGACRTTQNLLAMMTNSPEGLDGMMRSGRSSWSRTGPFGPAAARPPKAVLEQAARRSNTGPQDIRTIPPCGQPIEGLHLERSYPHFVHADDITVLEVQRDD